MPAPTASNTRGMRQSILRIATAIHHRAFTLLQRRILRLAIHMMPTFQPKYPDVAQRHTVAKSVLESRFAARLQIGFNNLSQWVSVYSSHLLPYLECHPLVRPVAPRVAVVQATAPYRACAVPSFPGRTTARKQTQFSASEIQTPQKH